MVDPFQPMQNALAGYQNTQTTLHQLGRQKRMDDASLQQNALQNQMAQERMDMTRQNNALAQKQMSREEAMARVEKMGPIAAKIMELPPEQRPQAYQQIYPVVSQMFDGVPEQYNEQQVAGMAQAHQSLQAPADYQIVQSDTGEYIRIPKKSGYDIDPTGVIGPDKSGGSTPYFTPVQTGEGVYAFDARKGTLNPLDVGGKRVVGTNSDPALQGAIAREKAAGSEIGESTAKAQINLPRDIQEASNTIKLIDDLLKHPGFSQAVGKSSVLGVQKIPGTEAKAFMVRLDQLKGKQFLQAFESLKGGGQITEIEGQKATEAMSRMNNASTEGEFIDAAREFQDIVRQGVSRAKIKAGGGTEAPPSAVEHLRSNPRLKGAFKQKYGYLPEGL